MVCRSKAAQLTCRIFFLIDAGQQAMETSKKCRWARCMVPLNCKTLDHTMKGTLSMRVGEHCQRKKRMSTLPLSPLTERSYSMHGKKKKGKRKALSISMRLLFLSYRITTRGMATMSRRGDCARRRTPGTLSRLRWIMVVMRIVLLSMRSRKRRPLYEYEDR